MTKETAEYLLTVLNSSTLPVGAPTFAEDARKIVQAKQELAAIIDNPTAGASAPHD